MGDSKITQLVQSNPYLNAGDKSFILSTLPQISPLEKLKLERALITGKVPELLANLSNLRSRFFEQEAPKPPDALTQFVEKFIPKKTKKILSNSIFFKPQVLGSKPPQPAPPLPSSPQLNSLKELNHPVQLSQLHPRHISFGLNDNSEQIINEFLNKLSTILGNIEDINIRRNYFMNFVQSSLFRSYLNTGMTALRHPELKPRKVSLNLLFQIDPQYLNNRQFQLASIISAHLRGLSGLQ